MSVAITLIGLGACAAPPSPPAERVSLVASAPPPLVTEPAGAVKPQPADPCAGPAAEYEFLGGPESSPIYLDPATDPRGRLLAAEDAECRIWIHDAPTARRRGMLEQRTSCETPRKNLSMVFVPDLSQIAVSDDVEIRMADLRCGADRGVMQGDPYLEKLTYSEGGLFGELNYEDYSEFWQSPKLGTLELPSMPLAVSPDGAVLAAREEEASEDGGINVVGVNLLKAASQESVRRMPEAWSLAAFSADGKRLAVARIEREVAVFELDSGKEIDRAPWPAGLADLWTGATRLLLNADGTVVVAAARDAIGWAVGARRRPDLLVKRSGDFVGHWFFTATGELVRVQSKEVSRFRIERAPLRLQARPVDVTWRPDPPEDVRLIMSGSPTLAGNGWTWDPTTPRAVKAPAKKGSGAAKAYGLWSQPVDAPSPDGRFVATIAKDSHQVVVLEVSGSSKAKHLTIDVAESPAPVPGNQPRAYHLAAFAFSPKSDFIAVSTREGIEVWNLQTRQRVTSFREAIVPTRYILFPRFLSFDSAGERVLSIRGRRFSVWNVASGELVLTTEPPTNPTAAAFFDPKGGVPCAIVLGNQHRVYRLSDGAFVELSVYRNGSEVASAVTTPSGLFDGDAAALSLLTYRKGGIATGQLFSAADLRGTFERPGLLDALVHGRPLR